MHDAKNDANNDAENDAKAKAKAVNLEKPVRERRRVQVQIPAFQLLGSLGAVTVGGLLMGKVSVICCWLSGPMLICPPFFRKTAPGLSAELWQFVVLSALAVAPLALVNSWLFLPTKPTGTAVFFLNSSENEINGRISHSLSSTMSTATPRARMTFQVCCQE
jgi:hypothetical protein